jgi:hypothetical protein
MNTSVLRNKARGILQAVPGSAAISDVSSEMFAAAEEIDRLRTELQISEMANEAMAQTEAQG